MIPIYDKGEYRLVVEEPNGWSFEPNEVSINIDGKTDRCSLQEDINFEFKGFSVSGKERTSSSHLILAKNGFLFLVCRFNHQFKQKHGTKGDYSNVKA